MFIITHYNCVNLTIDQEVNEFGCTNTKNTMMHFEKYLTLVLIVINIPFWLLFVLYFDKKLCNTSCHQLAIVMSSVSYSVIHVAGRRINSMLMLYRYTIIQTNYIDTSIQLYYCMWLWTAKWTNIWITMGPTKSLHTTRAAIAHMNNLHTIHTLLYSRRITWKEQHLPEINLEALNNYFYAPSF